MRFDADAYHETPLGRSRTAVVKIVGRPDHFAIQTIAEPYLGAQLGKVVKLLRIKVSKVARL
jgi:wyosine [tRNA(Phe)-imidazoG37] synthetase (radical SAM superfamily)